MAKYFIALLALAAIHAAEGRICASAVQVYAYVLRSKVCWRICMSAGVRSCVRACVHACVCAC